MDILYVRWETSERVKQQDSLSHTVQNINKSHITASFSLLAQYHESKYRCCQQMCGVKWFQKVICPELSWGETGRKHMYEWSCLLSTLPFINCEKAMWENILNRRGCGFFANNHRCWQNLKDWGHEPKLPQQNPTPSGRLGGIICEFLKLFRLSLPHLFHISVPTWWSKYCFTAFSTKYNPSLLLEILLTFIIVHFHLIDNCVD